MAPKKQHKAEHNNKPSPKRGKNEQQQREKKKTNLHRKKNLLSSPCKIVHQKKNLKTAVPLKTNMKLNTVAEKTSKKTKDEKFKLT